MYVMREKNTKWLPLCDLFFSFTSRAIFFWLARVENENSGKYMRLRANLWCRCMLGWVRDPSARSLDVKGQMKINEFLSTLEVCGTLKRGKGI